MSDIPELEHRATELTPEQKLAKETLHTKLRAQAARSVSALPELRGAGLAIIQTPPGQRITPSPQMQAMCDELKREFGITSFGTYYGHDVSPEVSVDIFVPMEHTEDERSLGDRAARWIINNGRRFGRRYLIWWQRIWNELVVAAWRWMTDRGNNTQNHKDHIHSTNDGPFEPLDEEEIDMATLPQAVQDDIRYAVRAANEIKAFIGSFDRDIPEGEEASFWDGQIQLRDDLRHALVVVQELKDWFGQFDPEGQQDYWRGRAEVEARLGL
jgi:hypothetical protein